MAFRTTWPLRAFTIRDGSEPPRVISVQGRDRWALEALAAAGPKGCTPLRNPAPRWSAYIFNLRKIGVAIDTITENHDGPFAGHHGRYVLACNVTPGRERGCSMMALRISLLMNRYGLDADRAAMLAAFIWGAGNAN